MATELQTKSVQTAAIRVEAAAALIKAAQIACRNIGIESAIAVTDAAGHLRAFERTDHCPFWRRMSQSTRHGRLRPSD